MAPVMPENNQIIMLKILVATIAASGFVERAPPLPHYWVEEGTTIVEAPEANPTVTFALHVKESNLEIVERIAREVSDPQNPQYGDYLSPEGLAELTAPEEENVDAVRAWVGGLGRSAIKESLQGRRFEVALPRVEAEALLHTTFRHVVNTRTQQRALVAGDYSVPDRVKAATSGVYGLHGLPLPPRRSQHTSSGVATVTPDIIKSQYRIATSPTRTPNNAQAVAEFGRQTYSQNDLKQFFKRYVPNATAESDTVSKCVGDKCDGSPGQESSLDIQYLMGLVSGVVPTQFWYFEQQTVLTDLCHDLKRWTSTLLAAGNDAPLVTSVSYGYQGNLTTGIGCKPNERLGVEADLVKLAARGLTIIFASGDSGSGYETTGVNCSQLLQDTELTGTVRTVGSTSRSLDCCMFADGKGTGWTFETSTDTCTVFGDVTGTKPSKGKVSTKPVEQKGTLWTSWPASSPWVTAVGATRFVGQQPGNEEMASDKFGSGGGFSSRIGQTNAEWQSAAVENYLKIVPKGAPFPPAGSFSPTGRATPDVSALGEGFRIVVGARPGEIDGTSASAPTFAAVVSLLNGHQLHNGAKRLGFLNPWLYQNPQMFTDVTKGSNAFGRQTGPLTYGYNCTKGWDPVTGLGTPNFVQMMKSLPSRSEG